jgi:hypothetical protein
MLSPCANIDVSSSAERQFLLALRFKLDFLSSAAITIISDLPQKCPAIRELTLISGSIGSTTVSDLICSWKDLDCVRLCSRMDWDCVQASGCDARALTYLSLRCNLSELTISNPCLPLSTHLTFPALRKLHLGICVFTPCLEFMRKISAACLSTLDISLTTHVRWGFHQ